MLEKGEKYQGRFWIVDGELQKTKFNAELEINTDNKIELTILYQGLLIETPELTNFLHTIDFYDIQGIILIGSKKTNISLLRCFSRARNSYSLFDGKDTTNCFDTQRVLVEVTACLVGKLIASSSEITAAVFQFSALSMWADLLAVNGSNSSKSISDDKTWTVQTEGNDTLELKNYWKEDLRNQQVSLQQDASFEIQFNKVKDFTEYLDYAQIYNDFFVLMTGRKSDVETFGIYFNGDTRKYEYVVDYTSCSPVFTETCYFHFKFLTENMFCLNKWFTSYQNAHLAYALFFDTYQFAERYLSDTLLDAYIRAFEGMITVFYKRNGCFITGSQNYKIVTEVKDTLKSKLGEIIIPDPKSGNGDQKKNYSDLYKTTLLESFSHSYELSLRNRIGMFLDEKKLFFSEDYQMKDFPTKQGNENPYDEILSQIISFRNAYAHGDDSTIKKNNLSILSKFCKKMILIHLYTDILGLTDVKIPLE